MQALWADMSPRSRRMKNLWMRKRGETARQHLRFSPPNKMGSLRAQVDVVGWNR